MLFYVCLFSSTLEEEEEEEVIRSFSALKTSASRRHTISLLLETKTTPAMAAAAAAAEDDAAKKKKTDCVYFLASPLTCKKGNECEFRHSENARVNPRDCRFWLLGNCLHRDCPFRHPPLDGRPVAPTPSVGVPAGVTNKGRVPCYYYSQGFCAKGDKCAFMHGTPIVPNVQAPLSQKHSKLANLNGSEVNDKLLTKTEADACSLKRSPGSKVEPKLTSYPVETLHSDKAEPLEVKDDCFEGSLTIQNGLSKARLGQESSGSDSSKAQHRQAYPAEGRHENSREPEDMLEASSPPFDVLVDDGPDQLLYAEDGEYHSNREYPLDSGQGIYREDTDEFDYQYLELYGHEGGQYGHEHYEDYEHRGEFEPDHPRYAHQSYNDDFPDQVDHRRGAMKSEYLFNQQVGRDKIRHSVERESRRITGVNDLRNHIVQRRRQEKSAENRPWRDFLERSPTIFRTQRLPEGRRSEHALHYKDQLFDQVERASDRRSLHKNSRLNKRISRRLRHDTVSDPSAHSTEKLITAKHQTYNEHEHGRVGGRLKGRIKMNTLINHSVESGAVQQAPESRNSEVPKEVSDFVGPKSLAQIRAEKRKTGDEDTTEVTELPTLSKSVINGTSIGISSRSGSSGSQLALTSRDATLRDVEPSDSHDFKVAAFEGPKPLSALLKSKRKGNLESDIKPDNFPREKVRRRITHRPMLDEPTSFMSTASMDRHFDSEMEEKPYSIPSSKASIMEKASSDDRKYAESFSKEMRIKSCSADAKSDLASYRYGGPQHLNDDLDDISMTESGVNTFVPSDTDDYGVDYEEDDDFAKKLGGFFS
ncbi:hypothetical protein O6H91_Y472000 [Diphasiastrum complanatum]|nr:hypothetical protein O6H91_Y472000 [Diphasiastrum complanatum]